MNAAYNAGVECVHAARACNEQHDLAYSLAFIHLFFFFRKNGWETCCISIRIEVLPPHRHFN